MSRLYEITIPGLSMRTDFPAVRHRLLADFPAVEEVLATTIPATVLIAYHGEDEVDAWLDALSDSVATRRISLGLGVVESARVPSPSRDQGRQVIELVGAVRDQAPRPLRVVHG